MLTPTEAFYNALAQRKAKGVKPAKKKLPIWFYPNSQEREFARIMNSFVKEIVKNLKEHLIPEIPSMIEEVDFKTPMRGDDFMSRLRSIFVFIDKKLASKRTETTIKVIEEGQQINRFNEKQFHKAVESAFEIDIFQNEPWLKDQLELFANQNAQLINSLESEELNRVAGIVERGLQQGERFETVAKEIQKTFGITHRRANLIARDQTSKLNASLTRLRQEHIGVEEYIWQTAGDERVRPSHKANNGKKFRWDTPPKITGHVGHDINCRCVALAVMDGFLDFKMGNG